MATITPISIGQGANAAVAQTLSLADDFAYKTGGKQLILLQNDTGGSVDITFLGDSATTVNCPGLGDPIDVSTGFTVTLADTENTIIQVDSIKAYLTDSANQPAITSDIAGVEIFLFEL